MQAMRVHTLDGISALQLEEVDNPEPGPGEIRVRVRAAGCNFADTLQISGLYQTRPPLPFIPGLEVAGEVSALGPDVDGLAPGDRVMGWVPWGGYATEAIVSAWAAIPVPASMDWVTAAAWPICYGTAYGALTHKRVALQAGETLLVHGAAGGVGLAAVDIGKALGARVVGTASTLDKLAACTALGADHVINYTEGELRDAIKSAVGGVDVVLDPVGGDVFDTSLRVTNRDGRLVVIGFTSGRISEIPANYLLLKNISVAGYAFSIYSRADHGHYAQVFAELGDHYAAGRLTPRIDTVMPLADTPAALQRLIDRQAIGKVVIEMPD
ncbi:MAG: NADPH:quinone oxidoreductase family protein [Pseudomonadota bacterium]